MNQIVELFSDYTFLIVLIGTGLLSLTSGILAVIMVLQKESLVADSISHATLPGIIVAFLLFSTRNIYILLAGGIVAALLAMGIIYLLRQIKVLNFNGILATILSSFFGFGMVLLTVSQKDPNAAQAGIRNFIFGQAAAINQNDIFMIIVISVIVIIILFLIYKELKLFIFDKSFGKSIGFSPNVIQGILFIVVVITIVIQIQIIGVILTSTMLVAPAVAAIQWCNKFHTTILLSMIVGLFSAIIGTTISTIVPDISTGPIIAILACLFAIVSIIVAPSGMIMTRIRAAKLK